MSSARRYLLSRPRTKMYDYNYTMGERMYRPTLDSLDQRGARSASSAAAREAAEATAAAIFSPPPPRCRSESSDAGDEISAKISRLRASRAAMEEETRAMEETQQSRRAAARARLDISDRLMDSVGIKSNGNSEEISFSRRPRRAISEIEEDPFFKKRTFAIDSDDSVQRWTKVDMNGSSSAAENGFSSTGAMNRAKQSRARLAEIDSEMDELAERSKARLARRAAAEAVLNEAADLSNSTSSSQTVRVKRTTVTEKRSIM